MFQSIHFKIKFDLLSLAFCFKHEYQYPSLLLSINSCMHVFLCVENGWFLRDLLKFLDFGLVFTKFASILFLYTALWLTLILAFNFSTTIFSFSSLLMDQLYSPLRWLSQYHPWDNHRFIRSFQSWVFLFFSYFTYQRSGLKVAIFSLWFDQFNFCFTIEILKPHIWF